MKFYYFTDFSKVRMKTVHLRSINLFLCYVNLTPLGDNKNDNDNKNYS